MGGGGGVCFGLVFVSDTHQQPGRGHGGVKFLEPVYMSRVNKMKEKKMKENKRRP